MKTEADFIREELAGMAASFGELAEMAPELAAIAGVCAEALRNGSKIMFCGNGGSAADAQHLAAELVGRYKLERAAMNALALTVDTSILTAVGNDYGYEEIFRRQVEGLGCEGDVLVGLSTSGNSRNVVVAMELAKSKGIATVAFTGRAGGRMAEMADYAIRVPSDATNHIQEMHIACGHLVCELAERSIHGKP